MKNKVRNVLAALVLCMSAIALPVTAYASTGSDTTPPTLTATLKDDKLTVEASDDMSGVEAVYVDGTRINSLVNGKALKDLPKIKPFLITSILRDGRFIIPNGNEIIRENDYIFLMTRTEDMKEIERSLGFKRKVIQEVITLTVFTVFMLLFFKTEHLRLNHLMGFLCLIGAVYFIFKK